MRLVVAVVQDYDTDRLLSAVTAAGLAATRLASSGGFLRTGNTTVLMGVPTGEVERCLALVRATCGRRPAVPQPSTFSDAEWQETTIDEVQVGGAVLFVVPVARFVRFPRVVNLDR